MYKYTLATLRLKAHAGLGEKRISIFDTGGTKGNSTGN